MTDDYFAGLFDGEGWFSIVRNNGLRNGGKRQYQYQCAACLCIREREIIEMMVERYGGRIHLKKPAKETHSETWQWTASGKAALAFASRMQSLLLAKRLHARTIIEFQAAKNAWGPQALSDEQYKLYGDLYDRMRSLNERGVGKVLSI